MARGYLEERSRQLFHHNKKCLDIPTVDLGNTSHKRLTRVLQYLHKRKFFFVFCDIEHTDRMRLLEKALMINTSLQTCIVEGDGYENKALSAVVRALACIPSLEHVELIHHDYGEEEMLAIAHILQEQHALLVLRMRYNQHGFGSDTFGSFAQSLATNTTLISLDLYAMRISAAELMDLAKALEINTVLQTLNIGSNRLCGTAIQPLAEALLVNSTLTSLNFSFNPLSNVGIESLTDALQDNTTLTSLMLDYTSVNSAEIQLICDMLKVNTGLAYLDLSHASFEAEDFEQLVACMEINTVLQRLCLRRCRVYDEWIVSLIRKNKSLIELDLQVAGIFPAEWINIAEALKSNTVLVSVLVDDDVKNDEAFASIQESTRRNLRLRCYTHSLVDAAASRVIQCHIPFRNVGLSEYVEHRIERIRDVLVMCKYN